MSDGSSAAARSVCIFCGASAGISAEFATAATLLTAALVQDGFRIGGGRTGIMGIVADTALAHGGTVIGVMPDHLAIQERAHPDITEMRLTRNISERKRLMAEISDAFVALPGGLGTLEEISEVLSAAQLGLHGKPCALLNINDYFEHLIEFVDHAVGSGFVQTKARELLVIESDPEQLAMRLEGLLGTGGATHAAAGADSPH